MSAAKSGLIALLAVAAAILVTRQRIRAGGRDRGLIPAQAILVFGAALWGESPSPALRRRAERAIELYRADLAPQIICSGSAGEAEAMRRILLAAGVPGEAVSVDYEGTTTRRTVTAADRRGDRSVIVVSSPYHLYRIVSESRRQGMEAQGSPASLPARGSRFWPYLEGRYFREVIAVWWYWLTAAVDRRARTGLVIAPRRDDQGAERRGRPVSGGPRAPRARG